VIAAAAAAAAANNQASFGGSLLKNNMPVEVEAAMELQRQLTRDETCVHRWRVCTNYV
jgi:hypothetical protein